MLKFSDDDLLRSLSALPRSSIATFGLLCTDRLFRSISSSWEDTDQLQMLERGRDTIINAIQGLGDAATNLRDFEKSLLELIPKEEEDPSYEAAVVEDAMASMAYIARSLYDDGPRNGAWAAARSYETADRFATQTINETSYSDGAEDVILNHPIVQQELSRQQRDLLRLSHAGDHLSKDAILGILGESSGEAVLRLT